MDEDVLGRMVFSPAARALLLEHIQSVMVSCDDFRKAVEDMDKTKITFAWAALDLSYDAIKMILNTTAAKAVRDIYIEQQEGGGA